MALSVKAGMWLVTQDDTFWQQYKGPPATVTADPLRSVRALHTVKLTEAVSLAIEEQEEAVQASQELADAKEEGRPPKTWARRGIRYAAQTLMNGPWQALRWWRPRACTGRFGRHPCRSGPHNLGAPYRMGLDTGSSALATQAGGRTR